MAIIRVIAIVVEDETAIFYKEDGTTVNVATTDPRLPRMVAEATPVIAAGMVANVDFSQENEYQKFEEKTGGLVKLFRVAKNFVKHIFEPKPEPQVIGTVPVAGTSEEEPAPLELSAADIIASQPKSEKFVSAADEIISKAQSVSHKDYTEDETTNDDTIIAVVQDAQGKKTVIPGMENLKDHMAIAMKLGSTKGVEAFLNRIAPVINKRGHSIADLLRFMSKNDMPIADDGCLVAFKTLNRRGSKKDEYQDIHSGNVVQRVGSHVFMKESMVDPNRRNACSNGLHVARRAYVGGFRGDSGVMVLIKVAPEDAIAVPEYDGNKMRVCGYHIVGDVPEADHQTVFNNRPIGADTPTAKLLGAVLRGDHIGITETVEIGGAHGGNLKVTKLGGEAQTREIQKEAVKKIETAAPVASIDHETDGASTKTKADTKGMAAVAAATKAEAGQTKAGQARMLFTNGKLVELRQFKKDAKKSYSSLGFTPEEEARIIGADDSAVTNGSELKTEAKAAPAPVEPSAPVASVVESAAMSPTVKELKMEGTRAEVARTLFDQAVAGDKSRWGTLWRHQKECKKSWVVLGFTPKEIERIKTNKPDWV